MQQLRWFLPVGWGSSARHNPGQDKPLSSIGAAAWRARGSFCLSGPGVCFPSHSPVLDAIVTYSHMWDVAGAGPPAAAQSLLPGLSGMFTCKFWMKRDGISFLITRIINLFLCKPHVTKSALGCTTQWRLHCPTSDVFTGKEGTCHRVLDKRVTWGG